MTKPVDREKTRAQIAAKFEPKGRRYQRELRVRVQAIEADKKSAPRPRPERKKFIYFMQDGHCGEIKIGASNDPDQRLANFKVARPRLRIVLIIPGAVERELHSRFSAHRVGGEWFRPHPDLVSFINEGFDFSEPLLAAVRRLNQARIKCDGTCR